MEEKDKQRWRGGLKEGKDGERRKSEERKSETEAE